jgi:hypothetical protein
MTLPESRLGVRDKFAVDVKERRDLEFITNLRSQESQDRLLEHI